MLLAAVMTGSFSEVMRLLALSLLFPDLVQPETSDPSCIYCSSFIVSVLPSFLSQLIWTLFIADGMLYQLSQQANCELVIMFFMARLL